MANKKNKKQRRASYQAPKKAGGQAEKVPTTSSGDSPEAVSPKAADASSKTTNSSGSAGAGQKAKPRGGGAGQVPRRPSRPQGRGGTLSWWLLGGGIAAVVGLVIVLSVVLGEDQSGETVASGWDLPALEADNDPDGDGRITLAEFEGKPLVVNFFASWCTSCDRELPIFRQAVDDFEDEVQIVFVNSNETGNWRPMAERNRIDDQILIDDIGGSNNNGLYRSLGGTGGMPITAFYDSDGNVFDVVIGEFNSTALYEAMMRVIDA